MERQVLIAPRNISGQGSLYQRAIEPFGHCAEVWSYRKPAFGFKADRVFDEEVLLGNTSARWKMFDDAVNGFDVFHFQFGRSLLPVAEELPLLWDLPVLRSLGKTVIMHFRGSDIRRRSTHLVSEPHSYFRDGAKAASEARIDALLATCRLHCDRILVSTPGLLDDIPDAEWLPHAVDLSWWKRHGTRPTPSRPVVVHAPSRRQTKGSDVVDQICRDLNDRGVIHYRPSSGLNHPALRDVFHNADIVVDSLGIGDHGAISVEAMAAGAVAVGHISPQNRERNSGVPVVEADPDTLADVLRSLAGDTDSLDDLKRRSLHWVIKKHDLPVVGARLDKIYSSTTPRTDGRKNPSWPDPRPGDPAIARAEIIRLESLLRRQQPARATVERVRSLMIKKEWFEDLRRQARRSPALRRLVSWLRAQLR